MSKNSPVIVNAVRRHPALIRRDAAYEAAIPSPRLTPEGDMIVDPMPLADDLIGLRPMSLEEQIARFDGTGLADNSLVPDEQFLSEDDFHDYLDDLPEEGLSPYEIAGRRNIEYLYDIGISHKSSPKEEVFSPQEAKETDAPKE